MIWSDFNSILLQVCNRKQTLDTFYSNLYNESFHAVIAGVCPLDTDILAAVTQYYHLTLVSKTLSSITLVHINTFSYRYHLLRHQQVQLKRNFIHTTFILYPLILILHGELLTF
jgi:hypothetical protein